MKTYGLLAVCLIACLLVGVAEPRRSRGGSSRGSGKPSRGTSRRQPPAPAPAPAPSGTSLSHTGLASLSYPGYNSAAKKPVPSAPEPPKTHDTHSAGWNVNKDTHIKKEVTGNVQSAPSSNAGSHSYPASGGQSGASGSHGYPASGGLSGAPAPAVGGQHSYPASGGNSGTAGQQHSYPVSGANSGTGGQQHGYPAGNGLSGSAAGHQQVGAPASAVNSYPVNSQNAYPANNQPYPGHNNNPSNTGYNNMGHGAPPPPYSQGHPPAYGGAPGHGAPPGYGAPPAYGPGYGGPGYGGQPSYGSHGYGGMGGYGGGGFGGGGFGGGYGNAFAGYAQPKSSFLSGNKFGLILAGLAVWNLARSGSSTNHYHYYDNNKGGTNSDGKMQPDNTPVMDPVLGELSNCTLTLTNGNNTDVIAIPCVMATSFAPNAKPGDPKATRIESSDSSSALNCTITVTTKNGTEIKTDIPCEELSKMAPKENATVGIPPQGGMGLNCTSDANGGVPGVNPCVVTGAPFNPDFPLEVIPLSSPSTTTVDNAIVESTSTSTTSTSTTTTTTTTAVPEETIPETTLKPSE